MSTINTNSIDANYPIPGQNNSTQGFRNNFAAIKQNLNTASSEITDLQNKVVLKSALANSVLNNDMANTLIANASTLGFRATTYNLGNALANVVTVDLTLGDVQYGNLASNVVLNFGSWAPTGTQSNVTLQLGRPNAQADFNISFPTEAVFTEDYGWTLIENSADSNGLATLTFPYDCTQLNLLISTVDCGNTLYVQPINRPFQTNQIQKRTPPSTGQLGDVVGTVCVDTGTSQLVVTNAVSTTFTLSSVVITGTAGQFSCAATTLPLAVGQTIEISGVFGGTGSIIGYSNPTTYYIISTDGNTTFTLSSSLGGSAVVTTSGTPTGLTYTIDANYLRTTDTSTLYSGLPVIFTGVSLEPNITVGSTYFVKNVVTSNTFTVSDSVDGSIVQVAANTSGTTMLLNPVQYMYIAVDNFVKSSTNPIDKNIFSTTAPNTITLGSTNTYVDVNRPVIFSGAGLANANIQSGKAYYIKSTSGLDFTISETRYDGVAGPTFEGIQTFNTTTNLPIDVDVYTGSDIFRRTPLQPF